MRLTYFDGKDIVLTPGEVQSRKYSHHTSVKDVETIFVDKTSCKTLNSV
jgi:hypothetical protein